MMSDGPQGKRLGQRMMGRTKRRILVRYGTTKPDRTAFTKNLSESRVFIQTNRVMEPGTTIQVQVQFPERPFSFWARVVWAKKVPPALAHAAECGMGVYFIEPGAEWLDFYREWKAKTAPSE